MIKRFYNIYVNFKGNYSRCFRIWTLNCSSVISSFKPIESHFQNLSTNTINLNGTQLPRKSFAFFEFFGRIKRTWRWSISPSSSLFSFVAGHIFTKTIIIIIINAKNNNNWSACLWAFKLIWETTEAKSTNGYVFLLCAYYDCHT